MKNSKRIPALLLTVVMVIGCLTAFTFTSAAETIALTDYATFTWGQDGTTKIPTMADGDVGSYWDLGAWSSAVTDPAFGTAGTCYIEADLGTLCNIESLSAWTLTGRNYKWDAYVTADNTADISTWTKIEGKTNDDDCTSEGYTVTLETPVQARYVRFYGMYNNANVGFHFTELAATGTWVDANANLPVTAPKEPTSTITINVGPSVYGQWENWGGKTNALVGITAGENGMLNSLLMNGVADGTYTMKLTLTDETAGKTYIIPEYFFDTPNIEIYAASPWFFRFAFTEYNIPLVVGNAYTIAMEVYKGEQLLYTGSTPEGQFSDWSKASEVIINDVPHDYLEPGEEPEPPVEPTVKDITITPYVYGDIKGFENWPASDPATQLLIVVADDTTLSAYTWEITIKNGDDTKVVTMVPTSTWGVGYRFTTCLNEGDNQFIPVVGTEYTISVKIYDGGTLVAQSGEATGFIPHQEPIVPSIPDPEPEPEPDVPPQTGDSAVYATIAIAVAAVALAVVFMKRSTSDLNIN